MNLNDLVSRSGSSAGRLVLLACMLLFGKNVLAATVNYTLGVDGTIPGSPSGTYSGVGSGALDGNVMTYTHSGNILLSGGFDVSVTYTGVFDLVAETGSVVASDCIYNGGIANLCDSLIQDTELGLAVTFVSAISGSPITVIAEDANQAEFAHTFVQAQVIPVPAAVWLFGSSLGLLGWMRRKTT